ncbi:uncharacterized protein [Macrobrachium rosenbergii]|uniref:uncharacterized protein n=1 Tax=Macrobrachium rosenbergii TaxID=79674 RepID=UPI0034D72E1C
MERVRFLQRLKCNLIQIVHRKMSCFGRTIQALLYIFLPVSTPVLLPDDHYMLRYKIALDRVVKPVMHKVFLLLRPKNGKSVKDHLFALDGFSQMKYKKNFSVSQRRKLDNDEPTEGFDISLLYTLLQHVCGLADTNDSKWSTPGTLENSLRLLKNHRNTSAHEDVSFTFSELQEEIKDMEELCRSVLVAAGLRKRHLIASDIAEMETAMEEVLLGGVDLWEPYKEALLKLRSEQKSGLIREGRKDILRLGKNLRILNPFSWLLDSYCSHLDVEHIFTELTLEGENKVDMQHLITLKLSSGELPDVIIASGPPGIGKTSLFRFLVHDWLSSQPAMLGMENIELIIPVELRHVCSCSVKDLLKDEVLQSVSQQLETDDIISALKNVSLLWLLDGYDEASNNTKKVIKEICKKFPDSRILITTRTEFRNEIEITLGKINRTYLTLCVQGFSQSNVEECAKKLINVSVTDDGERTFKLQSFMDFCQRDNRVSWDVFHVPLYITIIVVLWLNNPDKVSLIKSRSALYCLLLDHIIQKLIARDSFNQLNQLKSFLQNKVNIFLDYLGCVLWVKDSNFEFTLKKYEVQYLAEKCSDLGLPFTDTMSAFFLYGERATPTEIREEFTFIHRTLSDFLIARAFANKMVSENWDILTTAIYFFRSRRYVLLQYDPEVYSHRRRVSMDSLSKDLPDDIFQRTYDKRFSLSTDAFFEERPCCMLHRDKLEISKNYSGKRSKGSFKASEKNNAWLFMRENVVGLWVLFLVGYLGVKKLFNEPRREQLVLILTRRNMHGFVYDDFLLFIEEADDHLFTKMMCIYIKNITWSFMEEYYFPAAVKLLQYVVPKSVFLHYCYDSTCVSRPHDASKFLPRAIDTFANYPIDIHLDLHYFLSRDDIDLKFTKKCLLLLLNESSSCRLVTVRCPVDNDIVELLRKAVHLQELKIKFYGEDLFQLSELIKTLPELKVFMVAISPCCYMHPGHPSLIEEHQLLPKTSILLTDVFSLDPYEIGLALKRLCLYPHQVILQGKVLCIDLEKILVLIFWVLRNVRYLPNLEIVLDIDNLGFLFDEALKIQIFYTFTRKVFPSCKIRIKCCFGNWMYSIKRHLITSG